MKKKLGIKIIAEKNLTFAKVAKKLLIKNVMNKVVYALVKFT